MKKILSSLLILCIIFGLVACTSETNTPSSNIVVNEENDMIEYIVTELTETLTIDTEKQVKIVLDNVNADLNTTAIDIKNAKDVEIKVKGENELTVLSDEVEDELVAIIANSDISILGGGSLSIHSTDKCIKAANLTIKEGTYDFISDYGKSLVANEKIIIDTYSMRVVGDECLEATQLEINNGNLDLTATYVALYAGQFAEDLKPTITLNSGDVSIRMYYDFAVCLESYGDIILHGGTLNMNTEKMFLCVEDLTIEDCTFMLEGVPYFYNETDYTFEPIEVTPIEPR